MKNPLQYQFFLTRSAELKFSTRTENIHIIILRENCPHSYFFWFVFSRIRTEYGEIHLVVSVRIQFECGKIRTRKLQIRTLFTHFQLINHIRRWCLLHFTFRMYLHFVYSQGSDVSNFIGSDQKVAPYHLAVFR